MQDKLKEIDKQIETLTKQRREIGKEYLLQRCQEIFALNSNIDEFSWQQYTPYFNDGDPCIFRVGIDEEGIYVNGYNYDDYYGLEGKESHPDYADFDKVPGLVCEMLKQVNEDDLKSIFGDHAEVVFLRNGTFKIQKCSHH